MMAVSSSADWLTSAIHLPNTIRQAESRVSTIRSIVPALISAATAPMPRSGWITSTASEKNRKMIRVMVSPARS